jgi:nitric oxide reductase subunit C
MSNKGVRNFFVLGSMFFFAIFLYLTYDTMEQHDSRVPEITEEVDLGKQAWHKYNCIGCHTIFGNGSYFAPDLTKTTKNKPKAYLKAFLMDPKGVNKQAVMPTLGISSVEADNLIIFLEWTSGVDTNGWPPEPVLKKLLTSGSAGSAAYQSNGCSACHTISGVGGTSGPDLTNVGSIQPDAGWHIKHLREPSSVVPGSAMPPYAHLSDADLGALTDYLLTLK